MKRPSLAPHLRTLSGSLALVAATALPSAARAADITLAWDASPDPRVIGYVIHYGPPGTNFPYWANVGNLLRTTVRGIPEGSIALFVVEGYDIAGVRTAYSNVISIVAPSSPGVATPASASATTEAPDPSAVGQGP